MYALTFPKFSIAFFAFFFLLPLLYLTYHPGNFSPFKLFFFFAFLSNLVILYWIPDVMVYYGGMSRALGIFGLVILSAYVAVFFGFTGILIRQYLRNDLKMLLLIPSAWVAKDLLLEVLFGGFPWEFAGYSQYGNL